MYSEWKKLRNEFTPEQLADHPGRKIFLLQDVPFLPRDEIDYNGARPCVGFFSLRSIVTRGAVFPEDIKFSVTFGEQEIPWELIKNCVISKDIDQTDGDQGFNYYHGTIAVKLWAFEHETDLIEIDDEIRFGNVVNLLDNLGSHPRRKPLKFFARADEEEILSELSPRPKTETKKIYVASLPSFGHRKTRNLNTTSGDILQKLDYDGDESC
jgi:hypothetical protein